MAGFRYQAIDASGRLHKGVLETDSQRQVRALLREQGLTAVEVEGLTQQSDLPGKKTTRASSRRRLSTAELAMLTRQFATLLGAGLTIEQTMNALIEQSDNHFIGQVLAGVRGEVLAGQTLARAMLEFPRVFPELYRTLVEAGEKSGQLSQVMYRLADYTEERQALQQKTTLAFIYPGVVTFVAISVVVGLLTYVVPKVVQVYENSKQTLPLLTRGMIALSEFIRATGFFWLIAIVGGLWLFQRALRQPAVRMRFDRFVLRLPVIGRLARGVNTARLASTMAILVSSRVPLLTALQAGVGVVSNAPMKQALIDTEKLVREGGTLSRSLASTKMFPPVMVHLIASGEASGKLDQMLERVATSQAQEVETRVTTLTSLMEPLLILFMGVVVLLIVVAVLLPIFELNTLIK
ncbi:MAG: type II secretion system inner membrane protein GspF [Burkholderiales bacterium]